MKFDAMFQPIQIGPVTVKNRFVVPPMGNNFANTDGTMSEQSVAYYRERAKGGFGLITIEATVVLLFLPHTERLRRSCTRPVVSPPVHCHRGLLW